MIKFRAGFSRAVVIFAGYAFKFPRGFQGCRCNMLEARIWAKNKSHPLRQLRLCPVLWCAPLGMLVIMPAAAPLLSNSDAIVERLAELDLWEYRPGDDEEPFEYKAADWGILEGREVAIDYGGVQ